MSQVNVRYDGVSNRLQRKALRLMITVFVWIIAMSVSIVFPPLLIVTMPALIFVLLRFVVRQIKTLKDN